jgi:hypothetical protein
MPASMHKSLSMSLGATRQTESRGSRRGLHATSKRGSIGLGDSSIQKKDSVNVYASELWDDFVNAPVDEPTAVQTREMELHQTVMMDAMRRTERRQKKKAEGERRAAARRTKQMDPEKRRKLQKQWDDIQEAERERKRTFEQKRQELDSRGDEKMGRLIRNIQKDAHLPGEIRAYLALQNATEQRKKQKLFRTWSKAVFDPMQDQVSEQWDRVDVLERERVTKKRFDEFLAYGNKRYISRDIVIESEYDPFKRDIPPPRIRTNRIRDPLREALKQNRIEDEMLKALNPNKRIINPQSREMVGLLMWDKIDATPFGRYEHKFKVSRATDANGPRADHLGPVFDHYNTCVDDEVVRAQYFGRGKKTQKGGRPGHFRATNIISHTSNDALTLAQRRVVGKPLTLTPPSKAPKRSTLDFNTYDSSGYAAVKSDPYATGSKRISPAGSGYTSTQASPTQ